jgi:hypothetical protein
MMVQPLLDITMDTIVVVMIVTDLISHLVLAIPTAMAGQWVIALGGLHTLDIHPIGDTILSSTIHGLMDMDGTGHTAIGAEVMDWVTCMVSTMDTMVEAMDGIIPAVGDQTPITDTEVVIAEEQLFLPVQPVETGLSKIKIQLPALTEECDHLMLST